MTQIRRTIRIGGLSKAALLQRLRSAGVEINSIGQELFEDDRFRTLDMSSVVETVQTTAADLGLSRGGVLARIVEAGQERGLALCALELGPHLRLAVPDQAEGARGFEQSPHRAPPGSITVLSSWPSEGDDEYRGFYLRRIEGTPWLRGFRSWSGHVWQPEDMLVLTAVRRVG